MEGHSDMGERRENSTNVVIEGPGGDEIERRSTGDNRPSGSPVDELNFLRSESSKRKKSTRHNANQIQELETFFKENSHPDENVRLELATKLSMDIKQVQNWFQNKRTQMKSQLECYEKRTLKQENDKLRIEYIATKKALKNSICDRCHNQKIIRKVNTDDNQAKIEHDRLEDEVKMLTAQAYKILGPSASLEGSVATMMENSRLGLGAKRNNIGGINVVNTASPKEIALGKSLSIPQSVISLQPTLSLVNKDVVHDKIRLMDLALDALDELLRLAKNDKPLWICSMDGGGETLNFKEYGRLFTPLIGMKPEHFTAEATRASGTVMDTSLTLVNTLMDKNQWVEMFPCIVGKTYTTDVISTGIGGNKNGSMLLIKTELQIISDLVSVREIQFLRFCKKDAEGVWAVVDVSVNIIQQGSQQREIGNCRRLPSGCILQDMPNGYCKVTWIEHIEYNENLVHYWYRPLIKAGLGFGAQRWMATLQRQYQFFRVIMPVVDPIVDLSGERGIRMLAQRMTHSFCAGVCATTHKWEIIQLANEEIPKLMVRTNISDPGEHIGVVLSATKTIRLPVKQESLFKFFTNEKRRSQWDVLSNSCSMERMVHIFKDQTVDNNISLFLANGDDSGANRVILQHTCMDATESLLVYAIVDSQEIDTVMKGGDSSCVTLLSNGIAIVPDCIEDFSAANHYNVFSGEKDNGFYGGSLVTISFQIMGNNFPSTTVSMESIKEANELISHTIHKIKSALKCK